MPQQAPRSLGRIFAFSRPSPDHMPSDPERRNPHKRGCQKDDRRSGASSSDDRAYCGDRRRPCHAKTCFINGFYVIAPTLGGFLKPRRRLFKEAENEAFEPGIVDLGTKAPLKLAPHARLLSDCQEVRRRHKERLGGSKQHLPGLTKKALRQFKAAVGRCVARIRHRRIVIEERSDGKREHKATRSNNRSDLSYGRFNRHGPACPDTVNAVPPQPSAQNRVTSTMPITISRPPSTRPMFR